MPKERILYLDALRLFATIAVVFIHVSAKGYISGVEEMGVSGWVACSIYDNLTSWAVPVFVMISGAVFLRPEKEVKINTVFHKLLPRLARPYFFWWLFYAAVSVVFFMFTNLSEPQIPFDYRRLSPSYHLWYLPMLAAIYILIPFLKLISSDKKIMSYYIFLWIVFTALQTFMYTDVIFNASKMNFVMGFSGYFVLGYCLSTFDFSKRQSKIIYAVGIVSALFVVVYDILSKVVGVGEGIVKANTLWMMGMSAALFVWFRYSDWSRFSKILANIQPYLFGIYLIHALWVNIVIRDALYNLLSPVIYIPICVAICFCLSWASTWLIAKIPGIRKMVV